MTLFSNISLPSFVKPLHYGLLIIIIFLLSSLELYSEIRYVSKTGSSIPPYISWETASDSIMKAINISNSGDTIYVANGEYKERVTMIPGLSLIGSGMDSCIINGFGITIPSGTYGLRMSDTCYLAGLQVLPATTQGLGVDIYNSILQNLSVVVEFNKILAGTGIRVASSSLTVDNDTKIISKNIILNAEDGIVSSQTKPLVKDNLIYARGTGLYSQVISSPTYLNNIVVFEQNGFRGFYDFGNRSILKNNLFIILGGHSGSDGMGSYGDSLINNVVYGNFNYGIWTAGSTIVNNSVTYSKDGFRRDVGGGNPPIVLYNNIWGNQRNYVNFTPDSTNISEDPMFVNPDSLDLHLQMYSPLIDAGDPSIIDPDSTRSDIGIYGGPYGEKYIYQDLPPRAPVNFTGVIDTNLQILLKWNKNSEADFSFYRVYRDTAANFSIDSTKIISEQTDTIHIDTAPTGSERLYYKLTAIDNQGNESDPSEELAIIISYVEDEPVLFSDYVLYQNYPNPFNPSTRISYMLKERAYVKLYVYDIKGELVSTLVNQNQEGGYYEVEFSAAGREALSSGIYFYQIMIRNGNNIPVFTDIKKMLYIK